MLKEEFINNKDIIISEESKEERLVFSEFSVYDLTYAYLMQNGLIERKKLKELLKNNHEIDITLKELDIIVKMMKIKIIGNYYSIVPEEDPETIKILKELKKENTNYKKADFNSILKEEEFFSEFDKLKITLNLSFYEYMGISSLVHSGLKLGLYSFSDLKDFLEEDGFNISLNTQKEIHELVKKYRDDISVWLYNGYTLKEFNELNKN